MKKLENLEQLKELIEVGYEIEFSLNGKGWLVEPDQQAEEFSERRELVSTQKDNLFFVKRFKNTDELLDFEIDGITLKNSWQRMRNIEY